MGCGVVKKTSRDGPANKKQEAVILPPALFIGLGVMQWPSFAKMVSNDAFCIGECPEALVSFKNYGNTF